jgi:hypothetical protein
MPSWTRPESAIPTTRARVPDPGRGIPPPGPPPPRRIHTTIPRTATPPTSCIPVDRASRPWLPVMRPTRPFRKPLPPNQHWTPLPLSRMVAMLSSLRGQQSRTNNGSADFGRWSRFGLPKTERGGDVLVAAVPHPTFVADDVRRRPPPQKKRKARNPSPIPASSPACHSLRI